MVHATIREDSLTDIALFFQCLAGGHVVIAIVVAVVAGLR
jgi:hypothetical protein